MNLGVASRFSVLKLEDDEPKVDKNLKVPKSKTQNDKNKKKKPAVHKKATNSSTSETKRKKKSKEAPTEKQWEQWKSLDEKRVSETYEEDLQEALLLSKIEHEKSKENSENKTKKKKKDVKQTVSLGQFNQMSMKQLKILSTDNAEDDQANKRNTEPNFFQNIEKDAEQIISKEHKKDGLKNRETFLADSAVSLQIQKELDRKDVKIIELEKEILIWKTKENILQVQNKKLSNILAQGEMREKAEILRQNQELLHIKEELTNEVLELHQALEQEKSKSGKHK